MRSNKTIKILLNSTKWSEMIQKWLFQEKMTIMSYTDQRQIERYKKRDRIIRIGERIQLQS